MKLQTESAGILWFELVPGKVSYKLHTFSWYAVYLQETLGLAELHDGAATETLPVWKIIPFQWLWFMVPLPRSGLIYTDLLPRGLLNGGLVVIPSFTDFMRVSHKRFYNKTTLGKALPELYSFL